MPTILVVDDDPDFVEWVRLVLEPQGHQILTAPNGQSGLRLAEEAQPDLVLLDVIMSSVLDGLRMSQQMRESAACRGIPILMVTSIANTDYAELFPTDEYIHIDDFISKPIAPQELVARVRCLLHP
ncbi:MAG: response regulator [Chloroflexi bacterium]|nr:response regulator [Chloroflexota bacterium]